MLAFIRGIVAYKDAEKAIIETAGIGYELLMSVHALAALPQTGNTAQVWTVLSVKEDAVSLFGFASPEEKDLFGRLITVNGVGPKMAISALSTFKPAELVSCIAAGDVGALSRIPGVGKKTAQRMIVDLQGMLTAQDSLGSSIDAGEASHLRDAVVALEGMGFTPEEVQTALKDCTQTDTSAIIRYALKHMGGSR